MKGAGVEKEEARENGTKLT